MPGTATKGDFFKGNVGKEWWCVEEDEYLISIDRRGSRVLRCTRSTPYSSWLGLKKRNLLDTEEKTLVFQNTIKGTNPIHPSDLFP